MKGVPSRVEGHAKNAANALYNMASAASSVPPGYGDGFSLYNFLYGTKDGVKNFGENMVSFAQSLVDFNTTMQTIDREELAWAIGVITDLFGMISTVTLSDSDTIWEFGDALAELAKNGIRNFVDAFTLAKEDVQEAVDNFTGAFIDSLEDPNLRQNMRLAFEGHLTALIIRINERRADFITAGKDTVQGFIDGMKSKMDALAYDNPGEEMGQIVLKGIKGPKALAIASPSRRMHEAGVYTIEGFINGLTSLFPQLQETTEETGEVVTGGLWGAVESGISRLESWGLGILGKTQDGIAAAAESVGDILSAGFDTDVTIRPVMDLSTLKAQYGSDWSKYGGMFSGTANVNLVSDTVAKMAGTASLGDQISELTNAVNGFRQAYLDDEGYDPDLIAAAVEKGAMRGTSEGLAQTSIYMDGKNVASGVSSRQSSYERVNGGHKVSAVWYK